MLPGERKVIQWPRMTWPIWTHFGKDHGHSTDYRLVKTRLKNSDPFKSSRAYRRTDGQDENIKKKLTTRNKDRSWKNNGLHNFVPQEKYLENFFTGTGSFCDRIVRGPGRFATGPSGVSGILSRVRGDRGVRDIIKGPGTGPSGASGDRGVRDILTSPQD